jgi:hypothetical protein
LANFRHIPKVLTDRIVGVSIYLLIKYDPTNNKTSIPTQIIQNQLAVESYKPQFHPKAFLIESLRSCQRTWNYFSTLLQLPSTQIAIQDWDSKTIADEAQDGDSKLHVVNLIQLLQQYLQHPDLYMITLQLYDICTE